VLLPLGVVTGAKLESAAQQPLSSSTPVTLQNRKYVILIYPIQMSELQAARLLEIHAASLHIRNGHQE
jgi:hypothetical protein